MCRRVSLFVMVVMFAIITNGQIQQEFFTPVTINSPLFNRTDEIQIGANINNFGLNYKVAGQFKNRIFIISLQHNTGQIKFDPLNFNKYWEIGEEHHLIQTKPSKMLYVEFGFGYNFQHKTQKINLLAGFGRQIVNPNSRLFVQLDWGNESRLINAGVSLRANYTQVQQVNLIILEPTVQGKIKFWKLRLINQFGYSIPIKKKQDYMKPTITVGLEYIFGESARNQGYSSR